MPDRLIAAAGETAHFAEIAVIERDTWRDRGGALDMLDRFAEAAGLMRDDTQRVQRLGVLRIRGQYLAGQVLRLAQKAGAAILLHGDVRLRRSHHCLGRWRRGTPRFRGDDLLRPRRGSLARQAVRGQPITRAAEHGRKLGGHARDDLVPGLAALLAEQPHRRIPGAVIATEHPTPVTDPGKQQPDRLAERAGEMGDRCVDRDHEVKPGDCCRGLGEVDKGA